MRHARAAQLMVVLSCSIIGVPSPLTSVRSTYMDLYVLQDYRWVQARRSHAAPGFLDMGPAVIPVGQTGVAVLSVTGHSEN